LGNSILFVNKRPGLIEEFTEAMAQFDFEIDTATNGVDALRLLEQTEYKVVVTGLIMEETDGIQLISKINQIYPSTACVVLTTKMNVAQLAYLINQLNVYRIYLRPVDLKGQFAEMLMDALSYYDHRKQYFQKQLILQSGLESSEGQAAKLTQKVQNAKDAVKLFEKLILPMANYSGKEARTLPEEFLNKRNYFVQKLLHQFIEIEKNTVTDLETAFQLIKKMSMQFQNEVVSCNQIGNKTYHKIAYQKLLFVAWILQLRAAGTKKAHHLKVECNAQDNQKLEVHCTILVNQFDWNRLEETDLGKEMISIAESMVKSITKLFEYEQDVDTVQYYVEIWNEKK
jgi:DNA-binding NarL/FixJ family response regulator